MPLCSGGHQVLPEVSLRFDDVVFTFLKLDGKINFNIGLYSNIKQFVRYMVYQISTHIQRVL